LSKAFHLLEPVPKGLERLVSVLERDIFDCSFSYAENRSRIHDLLRTYADQPMSFADAGLVRMTGCRRAAQVFTTDADFRVYRTTGGEALDVLAPAAR